jgi:hypothetical protein
MPAENPVQEGCRQIPRISGNRTGLGYRLVAMAVNPDPKPGRWVLPLVILGMIAFTYFFVRSLPGASPDTTLATGEQTTTVPGEGDGNDDGNDDGSPTTTQPQSQLDPDTQAYLDEIDAINSELQAQRTELTTVNNAFNQDPREVEFDEAASRFEEVEQATQQLAERQGGLTPPEAITANNETLQNAIDLASESITEALAGLRSTDTGERRNSAVEAYTTAAADYDTEVANTHNAAEAAASG